MGGVILKYLLMLPSEIFAVSAPMIFVSEPPKKLPIPVPNVVSARPVTF